MANVEVRERTRTYGETSPTGDTTRDERVWEIGAEVDGVWFPFATKTQGDFDVAQQRHDADEANRPQSDEQPSSTSGNPTGGAGGTSGASAGKGRGSSGGQ